MTQRILQHSVLAYRRKEILAPGKFGEFGEWLRIRQITIHQIFPLVKCHVPVECAFNNSPNFIPPKTNFIGYSPNFPTAKVSLHTVYRYFDAVFTLASKGELYTSTNGHTALAIATCSKNNSITWSTVYYRYRHRSAYYPIDVSSTDNNPP